jgi:diamine N-acetyltransferase
MLAPTAPVTLREITRETVRDVCRLEVAPGQSRFVASAAVSIAEAHYSPEAWYRAIYLGEQPAGFVMLSVKPEVPEYYLWRFLVDARHQRSGVGSAALALVIEHVRALGATEFFTSYVPGEGSPGPFYEKHGFAPDGRVEDGEIVLRLAL